MLFAKFIRVHIKYAQKMKLLTDIQRAENLLIKLYNYREHFDTAGREYYDDIYEILSKHTPPLFANTPPAEFQLKKNIHPLPKELIMATKDKNWIAKATKNKGALRQALKVPEGKKIPEKKLEKAAKSSNPTMKKRAQLAETLKKLKKK